MRRLSMILLLATASLAADNFDLCRTDIQAFAATAPAGRSKQMRDKLVIDMSECLKDEIRDRLQPEISRQANVLTRRNVLRLIEAARVDKQLGGTGAASGSTSVGSSASAPSLLSIAVENGAVTQSTSGTVTTIRGNALGLTRLLLGNEQFPDCPENQEKCDVPAVPTLKNISFAVGFDTSRQSTTQAPTQGSAVGSSSSGPKPIALLTGGPSRVESFQARYDFFNRRDLRDPQYWAAWREGVTTDGPLKTALVASAKEAGEKYLLGDFIPSSAYRDNVLKPLAQRLEPSKTEAEILKEVNLAVDEAVAQILALPDFAGRARLEFVALAGLNQAHDAIIRAARKTLSASLEYNLLRPRDQPELSNVKFVLAGSPFRKGSKQPNKDILLSANFGVEFYNELAVGSKVGRWRDVQFSGQLDRRLPNAFSAADVVFTLAGYYQYQADNALIKIASGQIVPGTGIALPGDAQVLLAPKGHLGVVQGKITLQFKDSGVKFPIAITWSNRTQLIDAPDVRGNIGIAFDLDKLIFRR